MDQNSHHCLVDIRLHSRRGSSVVCCSGPGMKRFPAAATSGLARAVRVDDAPLAHTAMMLGWDESGAVKGDARAQAVQALKNADAALAVVGSSLRQAVKLHFYLSRDEDDRQPKRRWRNSSPVARSRRRG